MNIGKIITINGIIATADDLQALQKNIVSGLDRVLFVRYGEKIINIITL